MKEQWRVIEGYPNYEVSNLGYVRNVKTGKVRKLQMNKFGYQYVGLCLNGKGENHYIHRLVATAFIPNFENKRTVNHINGDKTDNRVENLEWVTDSENVKHAYKNGLKEGHSKQKVRCVETQQEFDSQVSAGKYFGCSQESVWASIHKGYRCRGYHFELVE